VARAVFVPGPKLAIAMDVGLFRVQQLPQLAEPRFVGHSRPSPSAGCRRLPRPGRSPAICGPGHDGRRHYADRAGPLAKTRRARRRADPLRGALRRVSGAVRPPPAATAPNFRRPPRPVDRAPSGETPRPPGAKLLPRSMPRNRSCRRLPCECRHARMVGRFARRDRLSAPAGCWRAHPNLGACRSGDEPRHKIR
jgi:hypothetical protein